MEVLLVVGILGILSTISFGVYQGFIRDTEISMAAKNIVFDLKQARSRAMAGENGEKWGVHFINGADDYYEIFSTPTDYNDVNKTIESANYLSAAIFFVEPAVSSTIIFNKISGNISSAFSVTISSPNNQTKIINVTAVGNIY